MVAEQEEKQEQVFSNPSTGGEFEMIESEKPEVGINSEMAKKPYERARIDEHEPLEEATATVYYYYTYIL